MSGRATLPVRTLRRAACAAVLAGSAALHAASFDCNRPASAVERAICSDAALSAADTAMAQAYRRTLTLLPPAAALKFRADQRSWLQALQQGCHVDDTEPAKAEGSAAAGEPDLQRIAKCMRVPYAERTDVLKHGFSRVDGVLFLTRTLTLLAPDPPATTSESAMPSGFGRFPGFGSLSVSWPEAQSTDSHWEKWNAALLQRLQHLAAPKDQSVATGWSDAMAAGADNTLSALTPAVAHGRVAVAIELDSMAHGAAHPAEQYVKDTWLLEAERPLTPQDVFRPGVYWQATVAAYAWNALVHGSQGDLLYDKAADPQNAALLNAVSDTANWTLTPHGLQIHWPEYALAPRYAGLEDALVPWTALQPLLNPTFNP